MLCESLQAQTAPPSTLGRRFLRHLAAIRVVATFSKFMQIPDGGGEAFVALDLELDRASTGPVWLKEQQIAECVSRVLLAGMSEWRLYELFAWVIMANHVHVLLRPSAPLGKILMNIKSASAREANALLGRQGQHFWQDESYDHWVRSDRERSSIIRYIHLNPVKAGLVAEPEDWLWSSASRQRMALPHIGPEGIGA
jgi:putative transposase